MIHVGQVGHALVADHRWTVVVALVLRLRVDLREALAGLHHPLSWVLEGEVLPWDVVSTEAKHVLDALGACGTGEALRHKHRILFGALSLERHEEVVEVLQILLEELVRLVILATISEAVHQAVEELVELQHARLEGLEAVDIRALLEVGKVVTGVDLCVHLHDDGIDASLQRLDAGERVVDSLLKSLEAQLVVSEAVILLDVTHRDAVDAGEQSLPVIRVPQVGQIELLHGRSLHLPRRRPLDSDWPALELLDVALNLVNATAGLALPFVYSE